MTQQPLISVVVPVYNRAELVIETLDSIAAQTYRPIEVVVVDDGSVDGSAQVADDWANTRRTAGFEVYIVRKANGGVSSARNVGIAMARGAYLICFDSDDVIRPKALEKLAKALERSGLPFSYGITEVVSAAGHTTNFMGRPMRKWPASIIDQNWHISTLLVRRALFAEVGVYREDFRRDEDWEFDTRLKAIARCGVFVNEVLASYRNHAGPQLVKDDGDYPQIREAVLEGVAETLGKLRVDCRAPLDGCGREMFTNALRYRGSGDLDGYSRCLARALIWSGPIQAWIIRSVSMLPRGLAPRLARLKRKIRRAAVVSVRFVIPRPKAG